MDAAQFEFIADLISAHGNSREGCRLMLVEGMRQCDAARMLNVSPVLIAVSIKRYREIYREILRLFVNCD